MNWYKRAKTIQDLQIGDKLNYNYPKAPYRGYCTVEKINQDGTIDVMDYTGRIMKKVSLMWNNNPMFKEIQ